MENINETYGSVKWISQIASQSDRIPLKIETRERLAQAEQT